MGRITAVGAGLGQGAGGGAEGVALGKVLGASTFAGADLGAGLGHGAKGVALGKVLGASTFAGADALLGVGFCCLKLLASSASPLLFGGEGGFAIAVLASSHFIRLTSVFTKAGLGGVGVKGGTLWPRDLHALGGVTKIG